MIVIQNSLVKENIVSEPPQINRNIKLKMMLEGKLHSLEMPIETFQFLQSVYGLFATMITSEELQVNAITKEPFLTKLEAQQLLRKIADQCRLYHIKPQQNSYSIQFYNKDLKKQMTFVANVGVGVVTEVVIEGVKFTAQKIGQACDSKKKERSEFTQKMVGQLSKQYPGYNVVLAHPKHHIEYGQKIHQHVEYYKNQQTQKGMSYGYEVYLMKKGQKTKFVLDGDGGYVNWAMAGNYQKNGKTVTFY